MKKSVYSDLLFCGWVWVACCFLERSDAFLAPSNNSRLAKTSTSFSAKGNNKDALEEKLKQLEQEVRESTGLSFPGLDASFLAVEAPAKSPSCFEDDNNNSNKAMDGPDSPTTVAESFRTAAALLLGTYLGSLVLTDLLAHWEWFQAWRYAWPFGIGLLYCVAPPRLGLGPKQRWTAAVLGFGLVVGGAADAFLPVYVTGPNVLTAAGMAPDAALGLFFLTFYQIMVVTSSSQSEEEAAARDITSSNQGTSPISEASLDDLLVPKGNATTTQILSPTYFMQVLLLAELYKLGEGSFDEVFFSGIFGG